MAERAEQRTEQQITVREVTHIQASWTERERGGPGAIILQLILNNGADEYVLRPAAEDLTQRYCCSGIKAATCTLTCSASFSCLAISPPTSRTLRTWPIDCWEDVKQRDNAAGGDTKAVSSPADWAQRKTGYS